MSDGGVYSNSTLSKALAENTLNFPPPELLPGTDFVAPYVVVADDAFALKPYMMKPYSQRHLTREKTIYNYRLSRARRVVENAFGILSQRFGLFGKPIALAPEKVQLIVHAACCLHNFLSRNLASAETYMAEENVTSNTSQAASGTMTSLTHQDSNRHSVDAGTIRDNYCTFFNSSAGAVSWQDNRCCEL